MTQMSAINLASEPFRRDRPMLVASIALAAVLAAVLGMQLFLISVTTGEGDEAAAGISAARSELSRLDSEEARIRAVLSKPENEAALERSLFLNSLLARKGVSWTLIFRDLEQVMPYNVKLVRVTPQVQLAGAGSSGNEIQLDMIVAAQSVDPLLDFVRKLESSKLFGETWVSSAQPPSESEPFYRYQVSVRYAHEL